MQDVVVIPPRVGKPPQPKNELARHIVELRTSQGMTQTQVAAAMGIRQTTYSEWERNGYFPGLEHLKNLAATLNVTLGHLTLTDQGTPDKPNRFTRLVERARQLPRLEQERIAKVLEALIDQAQKTPSDPP